MGGNSLCKGVSLQLVLFWSQLTAASSTFADGKYEPTDHLEKWW
jgi:hypothetical protein